MAVKSVQAIINGETHDLALNRGTGKYEATLIAPIEAETVSTGRSYSVTVVATDDDGNVTNIGASDPGLGSSLTLVVRGISSLAAYIVPPSRWKIQDRFNAVDYNRIKNNLYVLKDLVNEIYCPLEIEDMGDDKNFTSWFYAREFNLFERNLETINRMVFGENIGETKNFFANGPFIDYIELNRIEDTTFSFFIKATEQKKLLPRLAFRLGGAKGVKI